MTTRTLVSGIDLPSELNDNMTALLNQHLADISDLYSQTKQAHWNVTGSQFYQLHELFDKLAGDMRELTDRIAERIAVLGGTAMGTVRMASRASRLPEYPLDCVDSLPSVEALATRYASLAATTRAATDTAAECGDMNTADLFTEVSRALDKARWLLGAHVPKQTGLREGTKLGRSWL